VGHVLTVDGIRHDLRDRVTDVAGAGDLPLLRIHRTENRGVVVITAAPATRDGSPVLGNLTTLGLGEGGLVRVPGLRVAIEWTGKPGRVAANGMPCRLCFAALGTDETAIACACAAPFHLECHALCVTCPGCGTPGGAG
jgi:hypothetical protein